MTHQELPTSVQSGPMLNRRQLLVIGGIGVGLRTAAWGGKRTPRPGRLSLGLHGPSYYSGFCPFLNWQKVAGEYEIVTRYGTVSGKDALDAGLYLDRETGEIANPAPADLIRFSRIFYAPPLKGNFAAGSDFSGMKWTIKWDGSGTCAISGGVANGGSQQINSVARSGTFRFGANPGNTVATFTITDPKDPPRNIRIYQSRYEANIAAGELFNPDWLAQISSFGVLRFMDWMGTNGSEIADFSQIAPTDYCAWGQPLGPNSGHHRKGGMPLGVICDLANLTGCSVHVCIPHLATDDCVQSMATYFRDHLDPELVAIFEYSNECWNFGFPQARYCAQQASAKWGTAAGIKWYGYRAAQCMKIIHNTFEARRRWRGCLAVQTSNPETTRAAMAGVDDFLGESGTAKSATLNDLFNEIAVTGYFGNVQSSSPIKNITNSAPAVVTSASHGYQDGQQLKLFISVGMTELNDQFVTVANATKDSFQLLGVDSTSFKPFVPHNGNYAHPALLFKLMDESTANFISDPKNNPTKYAYFNRVVAESWVNGISNGLVTDLSVANLREKYWPAQKAIADEHGLELTQYEGGLHFVGDFFLSGYGGNPQFTEFLVNTGHTEETAAVYTAMYNAFFQIGGRHPSKFVEASVDSQFGTWGGMRFIPGDEGNPVWRAVRQANGQ